MKILGREVDWEYALKANICIAAGTGLGILVYVIFLYFNIAIFGWNLGLIFAPVAAGYVETVLAHRILGDDLGAISAFILFIDTTFYSFILKNPTLGMNLITAGSIIVILQAAFPTLINYILIVIIGTIASNFSWAFKRITNPIKRFIRKHQGKPEEEIDVEEILYFDEAKSNNKINSLDFFFLTSTDINQPHENLEVFTSDIIIENKFSIDMKGVEDLEKARLVAIKKAKDECLIRFADEIKEKGGNGVLDLDINFGIIGLGGDHIHVTATGMGIKFIDR